MFRRAAKPIRNFCARSVKRPAWTPSPPPANNIAPLRSPPYSILATAKSRGNCPRAQKITNVTALERTLQLGMSEEITRLERNMNWLATTAAVSPFIGLFGTVWGIINAFQSLGLGGATSMRVVAPGIAEAL